MSQTACKRSFSPWAAFHTQGVLHVTSCRSGLGMKGHEEDDARWMAAQGVDYLKVDDMSGQPKTQAGATADYGKIRDALNATVRNNDLTSCWFSLFCTKRSTQEYT